MILERMLVLCRNCLVSFSSLFPTGLIFFIPAVSHIRACSKEFFTCLQVGVMRESPCPSVSALRLRFRCSISCSTLSAPVTRMPNRRHLVVAVEFNHLGTIRMSLHLVEFSSHFPLWNREMNSFSNIRNAILCYLPRALRFTLFAKDLDAMPMAITNDARSGNARVGNSGTGVPP